METEEAGSVLQFDEALTWKAGKPIAVSDLLRRLKALAEELQSMDQEDADRASLVPIWLSPERVLLTTRAWGEKSRGQ